MSPAGNRPPPDGKADAAQAAALFGLAGLMLFLLVCGCTQRTATAGEVPAAVTAPPAAGTSERFENPGVPPAYPPPQVDVEHYDLRLDIDFTNGTVGGLATVTATALQELDAFGLDLLGFDVYDVWVDGRPAPFGRDPAHTRLDVDVRGALGGPLRSGARFNVTVAYGGTPPEYGSAGLELGMNVTTDGTVAFSEPDGAHAWYPCVDRPDDKAALNVTVSVPAGLLVASNGVLWSVTNASGRSAFSWGTPYPVATYLALVCAGNYTVLQDEGGGLPLRYYVPPDRLEESQTLFSEMTDALEFFNASFGPYPFEAFGCVVAPFELKVNEETQTMVLLDPGIYGAERGRSVLVHELAHHWWGDSVTIPDWNQTWLKEGMATYSEVLWAENRGGEAALRGFMAALAGGYLSDEREHGPMALALPEWSRLYSATTYLKGAWTFHMLRGLLGDDAFFAGLREYQSLYRYGVAGEDQLRAAMENQSGGDLGWFFQQCVHRAGHPVLNAGWAPNASAGQGWVDVTLRQVQPGAPYRLDVDVLLRGEGASEGRFTLTLNSTEGRYTLQPGFEVAGLVADPDGWLLAEVQYA